MVCGVQMRMLILGQLAPPPDILGDPGAAGVLKKELETAGHAVNEEFNSRLATLAQRHRCKP